MTPLEIMFTVTGTLVIIIQGCTIIAINRLYRTFAAITIPGPANTPTPQANQGADTPPAGDSSTSPTPADRCGPDCADGHTYDSRCTTDPHLDWVTTTSRENGRATGVWRCAEDDGCGHLSLGHTDEAAARRSYDRHRATECPRADPFDTPTAPATGGVVTHGFLPVGESRSVCDLTTPPSTRTVRIKLDPAALMDALRQNGRINPTGSGEQP